MLNILLEGQLKKGKCRFSLEIKPKDAKKIKLFFNIRPIEPPNCSIRGLGS